MLRIVPIAVFLFAACLFLVGCGQPNERAHPVFQKAERLSSEGKFDEAVKEYEKYLDINRRSAITHKKLADIYFDQLDDPLMAACHYRVFLELEPDSYDRESIRKWIEEAENRVAKRAMKRFPEKFASGNDLAKFREHEQFYLSYIRKLRAQNAAFRRRIEDMGKGGMEWEDMPSAPSGGEVVDAALAEKGDGEEAVWTPSGRKRPYPLKVSIERKKKGAAIAESADVVSDGASVAGVWKTYVVKSGDTLCGISKMFYGSSKHYKLIFEANRSLLKTESSLSIGQKLRIPRPPAPAAGE